jgi:serine/threonine-protein kinase
MAVVYRGHDTALDREVAVKLLHPHLAARAESRARFSREARAVARLSHPNIVEIYDYAGDAAVESYLVTEFVRGRTLRAFADEEGVGFPEVGALVVRALASALVHAHSASVIHRDLKPENVLLLEAGGRRAVKLVDFGIARILASDERMTMTGALVGSPNHMAPEIIEGREADARSDLFSLGTILYWLATGALPFAAPNPTATLRRVIEGSYRDPREASPLVSDELAAVVARALAADPAARTPTAEALREDLDAALAASGLDDPEGELATFLADPRAYKAALPGRLVASALARGEAALAAGETARGMKLMNRVLSLEPDNTRVLARLVSIERRAGWKRRARRAAGAAGALALAAALAWGLAGRRPKAMPVAPGPELTAPAPEAEPPTGAPPPEATATAPAGEPRPARPAPARLSPRPEAHAPERLARAAVAPAVVSLHVRPYAQRALLDGIEVARGEQRVAFTLAPGLAHRIQVEHACCFPFVREFAAGEAIPQPLELKVPLQPRPARLRVEAAAGTRVYVDGRLAGTAADSQRVPFEVHIPPGDSPYEGQAELRLETEGRPPTRATVKLRAGAEVTFAAPEERAP